MNQPLGLDLSQSSGPLTLDFDLPPEPTDTDNITDWCLEQFHAHYGDHITKDDIWEYLYGVMHAPDWRERYKHDLQRNLPRVPLAPDFEAFRAAGRALMDLHVNYETVDEHPVTCLVDGEPDEGDADPSAYRIDKKMRWAKDGKETNRSVLEINHRCKLIDIPTKPTITPCRAAPRLTGPSTASDSNTTNHLASPTTPTDGTSGPTNPSTSSTSPSKPPES